LERHSRKRRGLRDVLFENKAESLPALEISDRSPELLSERWIGNELD
jgi:hypothetical protein